MMCEFKSGLADGTRVRVKEDRLNGYLSEARRKISNGRIGVVRNYPYESMSFMVIYPKDGRKKEFRLLSSDSRNFEIVE